MRKSKIWWRSEIIRWAGLITFIILIYKFVMRDSLIYVVRQSLPPQEAGLLGGIIWGDKSGFEKNFYESLKNSGLVHLVVVSGSNVMLLVGGGIETMAGVLGRKKTIAGGLILGWGYTQMVGWEVPVVRAMLLVSILYFAQLYGRKYDLWRALILAVAIMVIGDLEVLLSVSFWLSITAFLAVITARKLRITSHKLLTGNKNIRNMGNILRDAVWVSVWITPILAMVFGKISLVSPISNFLVAGLVEVVTLVGALGTMVGMIWLPMGKAVLWLAYPMLKYLAIVVNWSGSGWWSTVSINFNWWMLTGWYLILFYFLEKIKKWQITDV
jgi:competence protein ComEC